MAKGAAYGVKHMPTAANAAENVARHHEDKGGNAHAKGRAANNYDVDEDISMDRGSSSEESLADDPVDEDDNYGDDFEEYDEDFEAFEDDVPVTAYESSHLSEVRKALEEENERASSRHQQKARQREESNRPKETKEQHLPASNLPERGELKIERRLKMPNHALAKQLKRAKDLKNLVEFDIAVYDIFDLPPMNEYDLYIRNFGSLDSRQVATQWNEDFVDTEIQTEDWYIADKWTQAPPDQLVGSGVGRPDLPWLLSEQDIWKRAERKAEINKSTIVTALDSVSLVKFLRNASQVMDILLEENTLHATESIRIDNSSYISLSQGQTRIPLPSFLSGRSLINVGFSPIDHRLLVTLWSHASGVFAESKLGRKGLVCMWRLTDLKAPSWFCIIFLMSGCLTSISILICEGEPASICASNSKPYIYICGTREGGVSVWDLREPSSLHTTINENTGSSGNSKKVEYLLRRPCYSTDALFSLSQLHKEPIVLVYPLVNIGVEQSGYNGFADLSGASHQEDDTFDTLRTLQVVSIDAAGHMRLWVVSESRNKDYNSVAETDLGMSIGSNVRLVKGSGFMIKPINRISIASPNIHVLSCRFTPDNVTTFLVGTNTGDILHESRFREPCYPRVYDQNFNPAPLISKSCDLDNESLVQVVDPVTSLDFSPHHPDIFLAGYGSGGVALFHKSRSSPLTRWSLDWLSAEDPKTPWGGGGSSKQQKSCTKNPSVVQLQWSPHRPSVFYVLDDTSTIYVWDLVEQSHEPTMIVPVGSYLSEGKKGGRDSPLQESARIAGFALSPSSPGTVVPRRIDRYEFSGQNNDIPKTEKEKKKGSKGAPAQTSRASSAIGASLILAFGDGEIEAHLLIDELVEPAVDEMSMFESYLRSL
ncbi:hypothetical protein BC829DRAFT_109737 [Chytridium lagenaria]|nr:hypothetical protein BC829DRAFT_109737 [Chytridium lagenaria]